MKSSLWIAGCIVLVLLTSPALPSPSSFSGATITRIDILDNQGDTWPSPERLMPLITMKLGDSFSDSAVRESIATLYLKGLFRDIRVEAFTEQGGVRVVFTVFPVTVVDSIVINGNHAVSTSTIRDMLANIEGKELRNEKLAALKTDLLSLYQAEGFYQAAVSFQTNTADIPHRVVLQATIQEGEPVIIEEITFSGNSVFTDRDLLKVMKSKKGSPLKRDVLLDVDLDAILKKYTDAGYPAAKPGPVDMSFTDSRAYVHIMGKEGPHVTASFTGNSVFNNALLKRTLLIWTEHDFSDAVIESSAEKIKALYREKGYAGVTVDVNKTAQPEQLHLEFVIVEGPRTVVREITFLGNTAFPSDDLRQQMALRESGWFTSGPFREDILDRDVEYLRDRYLDTGYLSVSIKKNTVLSPDRSEAVVVIDITEGAQTRAGTITFDGNLVFSAAELIDKTTLRTGAPLNERTIDEDRYRILSAYSNKGYLYARVDVEKSPRAGVVDIRYRITEDRPVLIGRIILRGNERTRDDVITREFLVKPGDSYDYGALLASQQRIYRLGYFRVARFDPIRPGEKEYIKNMLFTAEERPAGAIEFSVGYGDLDRLRAAMEVSHRNLWGTARYSSLRFEQSDILKRAIFNFQEPWLFNRDIDGKFSLVWSDSKKLNSDTREIYYQTRKTTASFGVEKTYAKLKPSLTYQFENVRNYDVLQAAQLTPEDSGRVLVSSLTPALIWDLRDDVFNPRKGAIYGIILKEALRELWSEADFSKLTVQSNWFIPISSNVLALSARAGMAWPFRATSELPLHERFYVGGSTTVRGYTQDSIGPSVMDANGNQIPQGGQSMTVLNVEFRINPSEGLGVELFVDAGNVWPDQQIRFEDLRSSYGIGMRYGTPIGPIRIDYGQKIRRRSGESPGELHFSIGNTF